MNKNITIGQAMGAIVTIVIAILTGWISLSNRVSVQEEAINTLRANYTEIKSDLKEAKNTLNDIKVILERKADLRDLPVKTK